MTAGPATGLQGLSSREAARRLAADGPNALPDVSHQAVYDVLRALTNAGLVRRIQPAGSVARYEARVGDNHHHLICRSCGSITDVDCAVGEAPCLTAADHHGFVVDEAEVVYWGLCPTCSTRSRTRPLSTEGSS